MNLEQRISQLEIDLRQLAQRVASLAAELQRVAAAPQPDPIKRGPGRPRKETTDGHP